jgi:hypothetical protein
MCPQGPTSDVAVFFRCLREYFPDARQDSTTAEIVDRLYRRYLRREELGAALDVMSEVREAFAHVRSVEVDWKSVGYVEAGTRLDVSQPDLAQVFAKYFVDFADCVGSAGSFFERWKIYQHVKTIITDVPHFMVEDNRPLEQYDTLEGEPFWLR